MDYLHSNVLFWLLQLELTILLRLKYTHLKWQSLSLDFWLLVLTLLSHYIFIQVISICMIISGILRPTVFFPNKTKWAFLVNVCYIVLSHITILTLDRPIIAEFKKGFSMKTSLVNIFCL